MLIIRPSKISWPISLIFGLLLLILLRAISVEAMIPRGPLKAKEGIFHINKIGKRIIPLLVGSFGVAKCDFEICVNGRWEDFLGRPGIALIDSDGRAFDIKVDGKSVVSYEKIISFRKNNLIFIFFLVIGVFFNILWIIKIRREV